MGEVYQMFFETEAWLHFIAICPSLATSSALFTYLENASREVYKWNNKTKLLKTSQAIKNNPEHKTNTD